MIWFISSFVFPTIVFFFVFFFFCFFGFFGGGNAMRSSVLGIADRNVNWIQTLASGS